tara:strand:+ start:205 stop:405 length:201 start_codon:yes stop_codon:yes gene_type:complete
MLLGFLMTVGALWSIDNQEFIQTANKQIADGYAWNIIECRQPNKNVPYLAITGPTGKEYVCSKLKN